MDVVEPIKRIAERATGIKTPDRDEALRRVKAVAARRLRFKADGYIPNNQKVDALLYRQVIRFDSKSDPAALLEAIFNANRWSKAWRNGVYDFVHYHSMTHEVLGIARGSATLRLGGNHGKTLRVRAGDVMLIPAGVGHECLKASREFLVVGAYPPTGMYNECRGSFREYAKARAAIRRVAKPRQNPLFGMSKTGGGSSAVKQ